MSPPHFWGKEYFYVIINFLKDVAMYNINFRTWIQAFQRPPPQFLYSLCKWYNEENIFNVNQQKRNWSNRKKSFLFLLWIRISSVFPKCWHLACIKNACSQCACFYVLIRFHMMRLNFCSSFIIECCRTCNTSYIVLFI